MKNVFLIIVSVMLICTSPAYALNMGGFMRGFDPNGDFVEKSSAARERREERRLEERRLEVERLIKREEALIMEKMQAEQAERRRKELELQVQKEKELDRNWNDFVSNALNPDNVLFPISSPERTSRLKNKLEAERNNIQQDGVISEERAYSVISSYWSSEAPRLVDKYYKEVEAKFISSKIEFSENLALYFEYKTFVDAIKGNPAIKGMPAEEFLDKSYVQFMAKRNPENGRKRNNGAQKRKNVPAAKNFILTITPAEVMEFIDYGHALTFSKKYRDAVNVFSSLLPRDIDWKSAMSFAQSLNETENFDLAAKVLMAHASAVPEGFKAVAFNDICWNMVEMKRYADAIGYCNDSLRLDPNYINALDSLAAAQIGLGMRKDAAETYRTMLILDPQDVFNVGSKLAEISALN